jgi:hypothetical protein
MQTASCKKSEGDYAGFLTIGWSSFSALDRDHGGASPRSTQGSNWIGVGEI